MSKSHDSTSMYVDTAINFAKYHIHIHTTYILHTYYVHTTYRMSDHIWCVQTSSLCIGQRLPMLVVHNFARCFMFMRITRVVPQKTSVDRHRPMQNNGSLNAPIVSY